MEDVFGDHSLDESKTIKNVYKKEILPENSDSKKFKSEKQNKGQKNLKKKYSKNLQKVDNKKHENLEKQKKGDENLKKEPIKATNEDEVKKRKV